MLIKHIRFSSTLEKEFSKELKRRVNLYFRLNKIKKGANASMVLKTITMILLYIVPLILISTGIITSPLVSILLYVCSGLGMAGIGMGIMHDANHGSYSKRTWLNRALSNTVDCLGINSNLWRYQHNVLHHTYTNIHGHDEDIDAPLFLLRFSPYSKRYKIHKFQHLYIWAFYSVLTLYWFSVKDFKKLFEYRKMQLITSKKEVARILVKLIMIKLLYVGYSLLIPIYMAPFSAWWIILGYISMHLVAGLLLSVVFQLAHVVPNMDFPQPEEDFKIEQNWHIHQLQTTSNFSPKSRFLNWYFGGLTNQIEHHLFPNICHVHYFNISKIVARTAKDYKLPYHVNKSFFTAVKGHVKTLKRMARVETIPLTH